MHKVAGVLVLLLLPTVLGACAVIKGYPDRSDDPKAELEQLAKYLKPEIIGEYGREPDPKKKKELCDDIVDARIRAHDVRFNEFQQELFRAGVTTNIGADLIILGLGGAIATVGGEAAKAALGAASAGVAGAKTSIDKNAFFEKTMPALLSTMIARRKAVWIRIKENQEVPGYCLIRALSDVDDYYYAGTLPGALVEITGDAGAKVQAINAEEEKVKKMQQRIGQILDKIDKLADPKSVELAKNPPVRDSKTDSLIKLRDPENQRLSKGPAARQVLKMMVVMGKRGDEDLKAWEAAVGGAE